MEVNKTLGSFSPCKATSPEGVFRWCYKGTPRCSYPHFDLEMAIQSLLQYMSSSLLLFLAAGLVALLYFVTSLKKSVCSLPPGPRPLPLIGNLNVVDLKKPFQSLTEVGSEWAGRRKTCNSWNEKYNYGNGDVIVFALCGGQKLYIWCIARLAEWLPLEVYMHKHVFIYINIIHIFLPLYTWVQSDPYCWYFEPLTVCR